MKQPLSEVRRRSSKSRDTPRLIIQETQTTLSEEEVGELPSYSSVQRMIQRKRKHNNVPIPNPATSREINVSEDLRRTLRGDIFLKHDSAPDDPDRFLILINHSISFLSDIYHSLLIPRCNSSDGWDKKNRPTYQRALQIIIEQQEELGPRSIMCDFEKAFA